jgi:hypothetical protein
MIFRTEKAFDLKVPRNGVDWGFLKYVERREPFDFTAEEYHRFICDLLRQAGKTVPPGSWHRIKLILAQVTRTSPWEIHPETLAHKDLGFS